MAGVRDKLDGILYLDDELINLDVFHAGLSDDYQVFVARNSHEAIKILESQQIKVLISDQVMPDIDGIEFIQKVNARYPHVICVLLTAYPDNTVLMDSINKADVFRFIVKPWDDFDLKQTINNAIDAYNLRTDRQRLIHDLQIAREQAQESDRLKSAFLANLSHEIRTPLNGILGFSSLLDANKFDPEKISQYHSVIDGSCNRLLNVIDNILMFAQMQAGNIENNLVIFDLKDYFEELCHYYLPLISDKDITLSVMGFDTYSSFQVKTDRIKLHEIFNQLIDNAVKFTHAGSIELGMIHKTTPVFYVKDSGIGIDEEKQKVIFQAFRQESEEIASRSYGGNGLGLSIAKGVVEMAGGNLWVESEKSQGSVFYFSFPIEVLSTTFNRQVI